MRKRTRPLPPVKVSYDEIKQEMKCPDCGGFHGTVHVCDKLWHGRLRIYMGGALYCPNCRKYYSEDESEIPLRCLKSAPSSLGTTSGSESIGTEKRGGFLSFLCRALGFLSPSNKGAQRDDT